MRDSFSKWYDDNLSKNTQDLFHFLRFESISTDSAFDQETVACAKWVGSYLEKIGMQVQYLSTPMHPIIYADYILDPSYPTVLFYQHYDVQPVDPIEEWNNDPFDPIVKDGEVYARGAQDNKGQCFYSMLGVNAFLKLAYDAKVNIKFCIEGDEEGGSGGLAEVMDQYKDLLQADHLLVVDCSIIDKDTPSVNLGVRGITTMEVTCKSATTDLHSGTHGGLAYNPIKALSDALSSMWDNKGRIQIKGFYDEVKAITDEEKKLFVRPFDAETYTSKFGVSAFAFEPGFGPIESQCLRPTLEINGIVGGYYGPGFKTVLPKEASAKLSCRLVPDQHPDDVIQCVEDHIRSHMKEGIEVTFKRHGGGVPVRSAPNSQIAKISKKAYENVFGKPCRFEIMGGSIPVTSQLAKASGADVIFLGLGLDDDNIHAPNEHFGLDRIKQGFLIITEILHMLAHHE